MPLPDWVLVWRDFAQK